MVKLGYVGLGMKPSAVEVRKHYKIKFSNSFAAFENLNYSEDVNSAWQNINPLNAELNPI